MEMRCPFCLGDLAAQGNDTVHCSAHGGTYRLLFARISPCVSAMTTEASSGFRDEAFRNLDPEIRERISQLPYEGLLAATNNPEQYTPEALAYAWHLLRTRGLVGQCRNHPSVHTAKQCASCGGFVCDTCAFTQADGTVRCPACAAAATSLVRVSTEGAAKQPDVHCTQHPAVPAIHVCRACGAGVCQTCDFVFPGDVHVCPACAANPKRTLSPHRRRSLVWAYVMAAWSTFALVLFLVLSAVHGLGGMDRREKETVLGLLFSVFVLIPSLVGTALSVGTLDRRLRNSAPIWCAVVWNGVLLGIFLILCVIGNLR